MRIFTPDDFDGDDTRRVQRTIDAAVQSYGRAHFPWKGRPYELEDTVWIKPAGNEQTASIILEGDPNWRLFEYHGPPKKSVFRTLGLKNSAIKNIGVRCFASECYGFDIGGDSKTGSSSGNLFQQLRFQAEPKTYGSTGFSVGRGGNDHSASSFVMCQVNAEHSGPLQSKSYLAKVAEAGHVGWSFVGGNTQAFSLRDCTGVGQKVLFKNVGHNGYPAGGPRTSYDGCAGSGCCLGHLVDGGFGVQIRNGRWELCGALLVHGAPKQGGQGRATVLIDGVCCEDFFPVSGAVCGLFEPGEIVGIRSDAEVLIQACEFVWHGTGEKLDDRAVQIASNSNAEATLIWQANRGFPPPSRAREGSRRLVVDGQVKRISQSSG